MKRGWFGPKAFGWGASPASWEGWLATGVFLLGMIGSGFLFRSPDSAAAWIARGVILIIYLAIVALTYRRDARTWL